MELLTFGPFSREQVAAFLRSFIADHVPEASTEDVGDVTIAAHGLRVDVDGGPFDRAPARAARKLKSANAGTRWQPALYIYFDDGGDVRRVDVVVTLTRFRATTA